MPKCSEEVPAKDTSEKVADSKHQTQPARARILVVEDNQFVREGIVAFLNRQPDLICCGQSEGVSSALSAVAQLNPDVIILDLQLLDGDGFQIMEWLVLRRPASAVLILTQSEDLGDAERAMRAGARGYVLKTDAVDELLVGTREVLAGRLYVSQSLAARLVHKLVTVRSSDKARANDSQATAMRS